MNLRSVPRSGLARRGVVAAGTLATLLASFGAPAAQAIPVSANLNYVCTFPLIKPQPLALKITSDIPASVAVGSSTPAFDIKATAEVSEGSITGLRAVEATSLEGTAFADSTVNLPGGLALPIKVPTTIAKTTLPTSGALTTTATGQTPSLTFPTAGKVTITVGDVLLNLTPRLKDGTLTGLDNFETECAQVPGQANTLATITVGSGGDTTAPSKPLALKGTPTSSSVNLSWTASTDDTGVAGYDVYKDGAKVQTVTSPAATVTGLSPSTAYKFKVIAKDAAGNPSPASDEITVTTGVSDNTVAYSYSLTGSATLKTLVKGTLPLTGSINAKLALGTGDFTADLALNQGTAKLTALGFLPVVAKVAITQTQPVSGSLKNGVLAANAVVRIKLPSVTLFGLQLGGGSSCQAAKPSNIALKSTDAFFNPLNGGTLAGTFAISDLTGCGFLNGIISPLTAGKGNAIALKLTPKTTA